MTDRTTLDERAREFVKRWIYFAAFQDRTQGLAVAALADLIAQARREALELAEDAVQALGPRPESIVEVGVAALAVRALLGGEREGK